MSSKLDVCLVESGIIGSDINQNLENIYNKLKNLEGFEVKNNSFFNEFTVKVPINASVFVERMAEKGILAGVPVSRLSNQEGDFSNLLLVASSEINSDSDRENFIKLAKEVCYE